MIFCSMRPTIRVIVKEGDCTEPAISDDNIGVEIVSLTIVFFDLIFAEVVHMSQKMCRMDIDKRSIGIVIRKFEQM